MEPTNDAHNRNGRSTQCPLQCGRPTLPLSPLLWFFGHSVSVQRDLETNSKATRNPTCMASVRSHYGGFRDAVNGSHPHESPLQERANTKQCLGTRYCSCPVEFF